MNRSKATTILSAVVALAFVASGANKLLNAEASIQGFEHFGLPTGFMYFIAVAEIAGGVGLFLPRLAPVAAGGLALIMVGAAYQHLTHDPAAQALPATVLLVLCVFLAYKRRGELAG